MERLKEADLNYLEDFTFGNREVIKEILELFLTQTPKDLEKLTESVLNQDWTQVKAMAHHIKPTLTYVGAESLREILQNIESMAMNFEDVNQIQHLIDQIQIRFETLYEDLRVYLDEN